LSILKLNQTFVDNDLRCPEGRPRFEFCDSPDGGIAGLYVLASAGGNVATYFLRYKDKSGKTCHQKLGRTTDISLAAVRQKAKALKAEITLGADPRGAEKKARKEELSFEKFMTEEYFPFITPRKRSVTRDRELARRLIATFGKTPLSKLNRKDIQKFHTDLREVEGLAPATADLHLRCLKHALFLALDWNLMEGKNPVSRMPMYNADNRVENLLTDEELQRLLGVLRSDANRPVCLVMMFLLSTGARLNEALKATWDQIDIPNRVFKISASNSKSKKTRSVPLNDSALEVLKQLGTESKAGPLFLGRGGSRLTTITKVWHRIRLKAKLPKMRIHDARHTMAQLMCNSGRSLLEVQAVLGHANYSTTTRYARLSMNTLHQAANVVSAKLMSPTPPILPESGEVMDCPNVMVVSGEVPAAEVPA